MTTHEKWIAPLEEGTAVTHYDDGKDGHPEKWVNGIVIGVSDEGFAVMWDDFKELGWETEYEWSKVIVKGEQIIEDHFQKNRLANK